MPHTIYLNMFNTRTYCAGMKERQKAKKWFINTTMLALSLAIILGMLVVFDPNLAITGTQATTAAPDFNVVLHNLTHEYYYYKSNGTQYSEVPIALVRRINVSVKPNTLVANGTINVFVTYYGIFNFGKYNAGPFLGNTIEIYYFGYFKNGSRKMLVYGNHPNSMDYFTEASPPQTFVPRANQSGLMETDFSINPMQSALGNIWVICGGYFETFKNNTNWVNEFNNLSYNEVNFQNDSIINLISSNCTQVH